MSTSRFPTPTTTVAVGGQVFMVAVAASPSLRALGLMGVDLAAAEIDGMLFELEPDGDRSFWGYGCLQDLRVVFFDADGVACGSVELTAGSTAAQMAPDDAVWALEVPVDVQVGGSLVIKGAGRPAGSSS